MRKIIVCCLLITMSCAAFARPQRREVVVDTVCNTSLKELLLVADRFCYQFQACPDSLFSWAYIGLGEQDTTKQNSKLKTGDVAIDIYVLGVRWWKDQHLGSKYVLTRPAHSPYPLTAHMRATYSGSILEGGDFILRMEPISPTQTKVHYEFRLVFGKVLSAFISDKTWHNAIEWRLATILDNIIEYAETGTVQPKK